MPISRNGSARSRTSPEGAPVARGASSAHITPMTRKLPLFAAGAVVALGALTLTLPAAAERAVPIPAAARDVPATPGLQTAVLAGGCFWGMEAVFEHVRGVKDVVSGFAGGAKGDATYDRVSTERTGHAEAVRITYDP